MEKRTDTGVGAYFSQFGKAGPVKAKPLQVEQLTVKPPKPPAAPAKPTTTKGGEKLKARTGRPPGLANGSRSHKVKATVHVNAELLDFYRDWSWEARCNLGELIERAMVAYKATRNRPSDKKTTRV